MCDESEREVSMEAATRIKRLFEATRSRDSTKMRQRVNDGLQAIGFILTALEREAGVDKEAI